MCGICSSLPFVTISLHQMYTYHILYDMQTAVGVDMHMCAYV